MVVGYLLNHLAGRGERPFARLLSSRADADWFTGNMEKPDTLTFPDFATLYCTADHTAGASLAACSTRR